MSGGQLAGVLKWLVPRYPPNKGTLMKLGTILTRPGELESCLDLQGEKDIPASSTYKHQLSTGPAQQNLQTDKGFAFRAILSISSFLGITGNVEGKRVGGVNTSVIAKNAEATVFIPTEDYMNKALRRREVEEYIRKTGWEEPLYVVVGVATADRLHLEETRSGTAQASGSLRANATGTDWSGITASHDKVNSSVRKSDLKDCDFAYRLKEINYSKEFGHRLGDDYTKGALLGAGGVPAHTGDIVPRYKGLCEVDVDELTDEVTVLEIPG
ncbi:hypothetical protein QQS21_005362 [Conoideocrella luteorostrata]|uniref:Uncharacterized protein n=1 Tax=Conoideocrella luteorostrata TaxID=1105319 RepID=A0AAJ0CPL2_9HYPO|nr:hypothetical protein QQS21_005362 [Conoideocrella luteorostrata]